FLSQSHSIASRTKYRPKRSRLLLRGFGNQQQTILKLIKGFLLQISYQPSLNSLISNVGSQLLDQLTLLLIIDSSSIINSFKNLRWSTSTEFFNSHPWLSLWLPLAVHRSFLTLLALNVVSIVVTFIIPRFSIVNQMLLVMLLQLV